ncbi:hypothetical protein [Pseudanabaena sp. 'Roaring Creek']|uniref:hypothetical protein n=1 Tax=Pseudanabaena sp. 'Roaring Creek' TaxID=1681830 RepID=UPI0006D78E00|nr:hypothetical protein [Pseudanabaena sp. 'Roaring Creek']
MENLREMPYLTVAQLHTAIYALCDLYYRNQDSNAHCLEVATILAFSDNLKQHLEYCKELFEQRRSLN